MTQPALFTHAEPLPRFTGWPIDADRLVPTITRLDMHPGHRTVTVTGHDPWTGRDFTAHTTHRRTTGAHRHALALRRRQIDHPRSRPPDLDQRGGPPPWRIRREVHDS